MAFSERFSSAILFACNLHRDQVRKTSGVPYIGHLLGVASLVIEHGGDENEAIAAVLHDAVEDQGGKDTRRKIMEMFGDAVVSIIDGCTDTDETPKPPWKERKQKYIAHLASATESQILVCAADKLYNLRMTLDDFRFVGDNAFVAFKGGKEGTLWYYRAVYEALRRRYGETMSRTRNIGRLLDELERVLLATERLA